MHPDRHHNLESGHNDYSKVQVHAVDSDDCHCSIFAVFLRNYNTLNKSVASQFVTFFKNGVYTVESKRRIVLDLMRHIVYLTKDDQAISGDSLSDILEMWFGFTLGG